MTALHHAAVRGHQNILLLLLHAEADMNAVTANADTPLHLVCGMSVLHFKSLNHFAPLVALQAALHGHESCVKALIYFAEHRKAGPALRLNSQNKRGDTALHLAASLGYAGIVQILLEYDADRSARNVRKQTASDCAHSGVVLNLLNSNLKK